jgi:hypothetical protein
MTAAAEIDLNNVDRFNDGVRTSGSARSARESGLLAGRANGPGSGTSRSTAIWSARLDSRISSLLGSAPPTPLI